MGGFQSKFLSKEEKDFYKKRRFELFGTRQNYNGTQKRNSSKNNDCYKSHQNNFHHHKDYFECSDGDEYCSCD